MSDPLATAIDRMEAALKAEPLEVKQPLSQAVQAIVRLRDDAITGRRDHPTPAARARLDRVNAILSVAVGAETPMGGLKWKDMEQVRDALCALRDEGG